MLDNGLHTTTAQCAKRVERKRSRVAADETRKIMVRAFQAYVRPLELATPFKYLGQIMRDSYDNWPAVVGDLRKARTRWARL